MTEKVPLTEYIKTHRKKIMDQGLRRWQEQNPNRMKTKESRRLMRSRIYSKQCMNPKGIQHRDSTKARRLCFLDCPSLAYDKERGYYCLENYMEDIDDRKKFERKTRTG